MEIVNQIGTIGTQETRILGAIVNIQIAMDTFPAGHTIALITTLLQSSTSGAIRARISINGARINGHITILTGIAAAAEASMIPETGLILTHGTSGTSVLLTVTDLLLTIDARIAGRTFTDVSLR